MTSLPLPCGERVGVSALPEGEVHPTPTPLSVLSPRRGER
jgi:hypothetical protein